MLASLFSHKTCLESLHLSYCKHQSCSSKEGGFAVSIQLFFKLYLPFCYSKGRHLVCWNYPLDITKYMCIAVLASVCLSFNSDTQFVIILKCYWSSCDFKIISPLPNAAPLQLYISLPFISHFVTLHSSVSCLLQLFTLSLQQSSQSASSAGVRSLIYLTVTTGRSSMLAVSSAMLVVSQVLYYCIVLIYTGFGSIFGCYED